MGKCTGIAASETQPTLTAICSHRDLIVWQKAMDLTVAVCKMSTRFPRQETYRLTN